MRMINFEHYTLAVIEGDGFYYINPNQWDYEPGVDRYTFGTLEEAREFRDTLDTPEAIIILKETIKEME